MTKLFSKIISALAILFLFGCENICDDGCEGRAEFVEFQLLRNNKNAIFGPDAFIDPDSIRTFLAFSSNVDTPFELIPETESISLYIEEGAPVVLQINDIMQDTFMITTMVIGRDDCCQFFGVENVLQNDSIICTGLCFLPIVLEL